MSPGPAWLPGYEPAGGDSAEVSLDGMTAAGATFTVPALSAAEAAMVADRARTAALAARRTHRIADVILSVSRAALRLADPDDPIGSRAIAALEQSGGWSKQAAERLLSSNAEGWTAMCLTSIVSSELGNPAFLDGPQSDSTRPGRRRQAIGPPTLLLILAGNVPGVAVTAVIRALLVRSAVLCKVSRDEPDLVALFAEALAEEDAALAQTIAATWWPAEDPPPPAFEWPKRCGKVIVYGGADAVSGLRALTPPETPLVEYGPRLGIVFLGKAASDRDLAALARDVHAYDQAGCVSPRLVYVLSESTLKDTETGPGTLIERLATALGTESSESPGTPLRDAEAVAIRAARARYLFAAEEGAQMLGAEDLAWSLLYRDAPGSFSESLPRTVWAYRIAGPDDLREVSEVFEGRVQAVGVAGLETTTRAAIEALALEWRASRVVPVGGMAWPPFDWRHDGRMQLVPLLSWTDFE